MKQKPLISVVIPAYNEENLIGKCIDELKKQTLLPDEYEIIVCDNNSTDKTVTICKEKGVKVVVETKNRGYVFAKTTGAACAQGKFIGFMDADCTADKNWLKEAMHLLKNEQLVCVGFSIRPDPPSFITSFAFTIFDYFARVNQILGISLIWTSGMVVKRSAFNAVGGYHAHMKTSDDWDLVMRLQKKYGRLSTLYTSKLKNHTYPRKQSSLSIFIPYLIVGAVGYITIHIFRISKSFGTNQDIR